MLSFLRPLPNRASRLYIRPPMPSPNRDGLAVVVIARNEARHIGDWLRFHALAGVKAFILYDNGSTDETVSIAKSVPGITLTVIPWLFAAHIPRPKMVLPPQIIAYSHAVSSFGMNFRWMAFIDIDEYLVPRLHLTLLQALDSLEAFANISLPWTMFGPSGYEAPPDLPAVLAYNRRARKRKGELLNFKCIVDPCDVSQVSVHKFCTFSMGADSVNEKGIRAHYKKRLQPQFLSSDLIQLNHYYTYSKDEMERKIAKGAVSGTAQKRREVSLREKVRLIAADEVEDYSAAEFLERHGILTGSQLRSV